MQALMATVDSIDAFSLLQNMAPMSYDSSRLVDVACIAYAHVDAAHIKELRGQYLATVQRQFQVAALQFAVRLYIQRVWFPANQNTGDTFRLCLPTILKTTQDLRPDKE